MKRVLLVILLTLTPACAPDTDAIVDECKDVVDQAIDDSFNECTKYYEETVIPQFLIIIQELKDFIAETCTPVP